jgi:hypothetical protein
LGGARPAECAQGRDTGSSASCSRPQFPARRARTRAARSDRVGHALVGASSDSVCHRLPSRECERGRLRGFGRSPAARRMLRPSGGATLGCHWHHPDGWTGPTLLPVAAKARPRAPCPGPRPAGASRTRQRRRQPVLARRRARRGFALPYLGEGSGPAKLFRQFADGRSGSRTGGVVFEPLLQLGHDVTLHEKDHLRSVGTSDCQVAPVGWVLDHV